MQCPLVTTQAQAAEAEVPRIAEDLMEGVNDAQQSPIRPAHHSQPGDTYNFHMTHGSCTVVHGGAHNSQGGGHNLQGHFMAQPVPGPAPSPSAEPPTKRHSHSRSSGADDMET